MSSYHYTAKAGTHPSTEPSKARVDTGHDIEELERRVTQALRLLISAHNRILTISKRGPLRPLYRSFARILVLVIVALDPDLESMQEEENE